MKPISILLMICIGACTQRDALSGEDANESSEYLTNDTIPALRKQVSNKAVASYIVPVDDPLNKWYFGVDVYETSSTFKYLMRMQYQEIRVTDTLNIPNFGTWPEIKIIKGKDKYSCIIGFLDKKKQFKEYKMLAVKDDKLKLAVLKKYYVGITQTKSK